MRSLKSEKSLSQKAGSVYELHVAFFLIMLPKSSCLCRPEDYEQSILASSLPRLKSEKSLAGKAGPVYDPRLAHVTEVNPASAGQRI